jgi:hypothetical protein
MHRTGQRLTDDKADIEAVPDTPGRWGDPLSMAVSLLIWSIMAALAWAGVVLLLRWL